MDKQAAPQTQPYPVILHQDADCWGFFCPDFGGGGAASRADALDGAQELLDGALSRLAAAGEAIPVPKSESEIDTEGGQIVWLAATSIPSRASGN